MEGLNHRGTRARNTSDASLPSVGSGDAALGVPTKSAKGSINEKLLKMLENNVSHVPLTDDKLQRVFSELDEANNGYLTIDRLCDFYAAMDHYGVNHTEREIVDLVRRYSHTIPNALTYNEFCCLMLGISRR